MSTISYYMKFQSIKLGNNVIKFVKQYYFIDYHSILATFSTTLHIVIFKKYWFEFLNSHGIIFLWVTKPFIMKCVLINLVLVGIYRP